MHASPMLRAPRLSRMRPLTVALALALFTGGCVMSVEPVVPAADATFDERLLGAWAEVSGEDRAVVTRSAANTYLVDYASGKDTGRFEARLGRLGGRVVLDAWPLPRETELRTSYRRHLIPAHVLVVLDVGADETGVSLLEPNPLMAAIGAASLRLTYGRLGDQVVLHGSTAELRAALGPYLARPGALAAPATFRRVRTAADPVR